MIARLRGIRKDFNKIAFIGPNPYLFLRTMPYKNVQSFTFIENSEKSVQKSYDIIE